jgi:post-segregation antitoxin (ccd killing protein)
MARVNITVPDDLLDRARSAGLNVSRVSALALAEELERRAKVAELEAYLSGLDAELGPTSEDERLAAQEWADRVLPTPSELGTSDRGARTG